jgi:hypothetical protein
MGADFSAVIRELTNGKAAPEWLAPKLAQFARLIAGPKSG